MNEKAAKAASKSWVTQGREYFSESYAELQRVQFPTRQETTRLSVVVLMIIVFVSVCLFIMDQVFSWIMSKLV